MLHVSNRLGPLRFEDPVFYFHSRIISALFDISIVYSVSFVNKSWRLKIEISLNKSKLFFSSAILSIKFKALVVWVQYFTDR